MTAEHHLVRLASDHELLADCCAAAIGELLADEPAEALALAAAATRALPGDGRLWAIHALLAMRSGDWVAADRSLGEALRLEPDELWTWLARARLAFLDGARASATVAARAAERLGAPRVEVAAIVFAPVGARGWRETPVVPHDPP